MANFIAIPLKRTNEVDLIKPLKNMFSSYCSSADEPVQFDDSLNELNKLRMNSTWRTLDKHESSLEVMSRYYDQLNFLDAKCPAVDFQIPFKWKDAFDRGTFFSGSASLTLTSLTYERVCILFNIAAMQSQIAVGHVTDTHNDDGLKLAAKYFQMSSGTYFHLKTMVSQLQHDPTPDLQVDTLIALHSLMLAQAQESFFHKAVTDNMKEVIVTKVAAQCEELYADALKNMQKESTRVLWEKDWLATIAGKQVGFNGVAQYYQSLVCKSKKDVGEEIARLNHAGELMKLAEIRGGLSFSVFKDYTSKITYAYNEAKKDNDFIYHARIPDVKSLPPLGKAVLAKPTTLPEKLNPNSQDLFAELLPLPVQQALQAFELRKHEMLSGTKANVMNQTQLLNGTLASLNLPAALEDMTGDALPQSLQEKNKDVRDAGGCATLQQSIDELPSLLSRNREILQESDRMLKDEEQSDENLRAQFKSAWTRTPSSKLNTPLKTEIGKFEHVINTASSADDTVRQKFNTNKEKMNLLALPENELLSHIPKGRPVADCNSGDRLKQLMEEVKTMLAQRTALMDELECPSGDMKAKFLHALSLDGAVNEPALSTESMGEMYGPIQKNLRENLERQEKLLEEIQKVNADFCRDQNSKHSAANRESMLSDLAAAYDTYMELNSNLEEGRKFYNALTEVLVKFQTKISDFCFARKTEREEICKDMQTSIVSEAKNQSTPVAPAHYAAQSSKPARPPPPTKVATAPGISAPANTGQPQGHWPYPEGQTAPGAPGSVPYPLQPVFPYPQYPNYPNPYYTYPPPQPYPGYSQPGYPGQPATQTQPPQQMPPQQQPGYPYPTQQYYQQQWHQ